MKESHHIRVTGDVVYIGKKVYTLPQLIKNLNMGELPEAVAGDPQVKQLLKNHFSKYD